MKKILIDARLLSSSKPTGIGRIIIEVIERLILTKNEVSVLTHNKNWLENREWSSYFKIIETKRESFNPIDVLFLSYKLYLKSTDYDVIFFPTYSGLFFKKKKTKIIMNINDMMFLSIPNFFSPNNLINYFKAKILFFTTVICVRNAAYLVAISDFTKSEIKKYYNRDSNHISLGVNLNNDSNDWKPELKDYFLYVGNGRMHKNLDLMISAHKKSNTKRPLVIIGTKIHCSANTNIYNFPSVSDFELIGYYKNAFCFVFPSLMEGFGLPIIEAYRYCSRIISSNGGSLIEFKNLGINYFNPQNEIELIEYFNREELINHTRVNENLEELYSWSNYCSKVFHLCQVDV